MAISDYSVSVMLFASMLSFYSFPKLFCSNGKESISLGVVKGCLLHLIVYFLFLTIYFPGDYSYVLIIALGNGLLRGWKNFLQGWFFKRNTGLT